MSNQNILIMVVDDEAEIRSLLKTYLEKEGFAVETYGSGCLALEKFACKEYSLLVLDLLLPDSDGLEICRQVRSQSNLPIIMLTAKDSNTDKIIGLGIGADDYITKPFDVHEIVARIKAQLRRYQLLGGISTAVSGDRLSFRGITIDKKQYEVTAGDKKAVLTAKEFELLCFLAENNGRVYTKKQIVHHVWPYETCLDENTLSVHIRRLRKKIELDPDKPSFIVTVWGIGYKFDGEKA